MVLIPLFLPLEFADTWGSTSTFLLDRNSRFCLLLLFSKSYGYDDRRVLLFSLFFFFRNIGVASTSSSCVHPSFVR